jgi:putative SOS response-associated peptidase YedK
MNDAIGKTMFGKREIKDPAKVLRLHAQEWSQNESLRISNRRRWDGDPTAKRMVIHRRDIGELALTPMRWGLVPEWRRGEPERQPLISVQADAIVETQDWRRLLNTHRCVVPTDQFYEWKRVAGVKTREYTFKLRNGQPLMIAALWARSPAPTGRMTESFAYVTCEANRMISLIHDRMPVILMMRPRHLAEPERLARKPDGAVAALGVDGTRHAARDRSPSAAARPYQPSLFGRAA